MSDNLTDQQRSLLLKGALYSIKSTTRKSQACKDVALWLALEGMNGDGDITYHIALTIPQCCEYLEEREQYVKMIGNQGVDWLLNSVRTRLYIKASRSDVLGDTVL